MRKLALLIWLSGFYNFTVGQPSDSLLQITVLKELTVIGQKSPSDIHQLPEVVGTNIYAGKKSSLVVLDKVQGNIVSNNMRQVLAKIPGVFIWENESSGIQINVASRGLSPNRSWEFNVRQNGYDVSADPFGYPEAYYNPQLQSVQRIEVVKGHGALQYGAQIGGMINYILKNGSEFTRPVQSETFVTTGSNGLLNTYQAVGGNTKKINYYAFFDHRQSDGWRTNNQFTSNTGSASITYHLNDKASVTTEFTRWGSVSQQPGGLTDAQFKTNPRQSLRSRNWFGLGWQTSAITLDWKPQAVTRLNAKIFNVIGDRESIGFFPPSGITQADLRDPLSGSFSNRIIDIDRYRNIGFEARAIHQFTISGKSNTLSAGVRYFNGSTFRYRGGIGSNHSDPDFKLIKDEKWNSEIDYSSGNAAVFAENLINLNNRLMVIPGIRMEHIRADVSGFGSRLNSSPVPLNPQSRQRSFLLAGLGIEYLLSGNSRLYFNSTQSYRPVQFADLTTPPTTDVIDPSLTDASGLNTDIGIRGQLKEKWTFDVSLFYLNYDNRVGTVKQQREDGSFFNLRTNIGSSRSTGIESFTEFMVFKNSLKNNSFEIRLFSSVALMDARYRNLKVISIVENSLQEKNLRNKKVEYAPDYLIRSGISGNVGNFSTSLQVSYTGSVFTDANNTRVPGANAQNGLIPAYTVADWSFQYQFKKGYSLKGGVNNLMNEIYFTRRSSGYPGPGLLPGDGRTFFITAGYVLPSN